MRVVHLASGREWRGGQRQVLYLARAMQERSGIDVRVMTGRGTPLAQRLIEAQVPVEPVPWFNGLDPRVAARLAMRIDRDTIVHAHDGHAHVLGDLAARIRGAAIVATRRAMQPVRHPRRYWRADAVIAVSAAAAQRVRDSGVDAARVHVIPAAVDLDAHARRQPVPQPGLIVCVAALHREKGVDLLVEAAAMVRPRHPEARWIVLGDGPERGALTAQAVRLGVHDIVEFRGRVDAPDAILAAASIAVQPSRREALGSSVLDALALGVPVVAAQVDGLPETLAHGGGLLVPPESARELAATVQRLLEDEAVWRRCSITGREAAMQFGIPRMVERTIDVYRSLRIDLDNQ